jgi:hypothetical protein
MYKVRPQKGSNGEYITYNLYTFNPFGIRIGCEIPEDNRVELLLFSGLDYTQRPLELKGLKR